jgi:general secretion pathway protein L
MDFMSARLLIRLQPDGELAWLAQDAHGRALSGATPGAPSAVALARAQRVVVLVPAEDVLLLDTPRVAAQRAQFIKAVPFALEDQLACPVEDLHFAVPDRLADARVAIAVMARDTLRGWLDRLVRDGIRPDAMFAETQVLPHADGSGCILIEDARALWRSAATQAGACDLVGLSDWLAVLAGAPDATTFEIHDFRDAPPLNLPIAASRYHARQHDALAFLAARAAIEPALNLLQGEFAPAHRQAPAQRLWRNAAVLAAAAVILLFVYYGLDCWHLANVSARLDVAARAVLHEGFPEMDKVAGDPRQLMQSALTRMHAGADSGGLAHVLAQIAPVLGSTTRTTLTGLEYHNATLELGLRAPDLQTLDLMRERLANLPGLKVEVTAANSSATGIDGRLRIAGAKP